MEQKSCKSHLSTTFFQFISSFQSFKIYLLKQIITIRRLKHPLPTWSSSPTSDIVVTPLNIILVQWNETFTQLAAKYLKLPAVGNNRLLYHITHQNTLTTAATLQQKSN